MAARRQEAETDPEQEAGAEQAKSRSPAQGSEAPCILYRGKRIPPLMDPPDGSRRLQGAAPSTGGRCLCLPELPVQAPSYLPQPLRSRAVFRLLRASLACDQSGKRAEPRLRLPAA
jgi:hypothetical protein